jgi:hypothetical protein
MAVASIGVRRFRFPTEVFVVAMRWYRRYGAVRGQPPSARTIGWCRCWSEGTCWRTSTPSCARQPEGAVPPGASRPTRQLAHRERVAMPKRQAQPGVGLGGGRGVVALQPRHLRAEGADRPHPLELTGDPAPTRQTSPTVRSTSCGRSPPVSPTRGSPSGCSCLARRSVTTSHRFCASSMSHRAARQPPGRVSWVWPSRSRQSRQASAQPGYTSRGGPRSSRNTVALVW